MCRKSILVLSIIISTTYMFSSCKTTPESKTVAATKLTSTLKDTVVIDVRELDEYAAGHIKGSINIPLSLVVDSAEVLSQYKHVVLVCRSGGRSGMAMKELQRQGLTNLSNGGGWSEYNQVLMNKEKDIEK